MLSPQWKKRLPGLLGVAFVVAVGIGATLLIRNFMQGNKHAPERKIQQITLLKPPPPPPPPPKIEKPPQPKVKQEVDIPEPKPMDKIPKPDLPPAGDLGLDAEGSAGSDAFGLIGRKGGRGLLSGAGDPKIIYAGKLQNAIEEALAQVDELRSFAYSVRANVWVDVTGQVSKVVLVTSTGRKKIDKKLIATIKDISFSATMPEDLRLPIEYRLSSRI